MSLTLIRTRVSLDPSRSRNTSSTRAIATGYNCFRIYLVFRTIEIFAIQRPRARTAERTNAPRSRDITNVESGPISATLPHCVPRPWGIARISNVSVRVASSSDAPSSRNRARYTEATLENIRGSSAISYWNIYKRTRLLRL